MKISIRALTTAAVLVASMGAAHADPDPAKYADAAALFKNAGQSSHYFRHSYAYALFPTVGEGALIVGGAGGKGGVFVHGQQVGEVSLAQVSVGAQAGGQAYSEIVFFEDKRALDEFESGNFEFGADVNVVAITAGAGADASTNGTEAGMSGGEKDAKTRGHYYKGVVVFTIAKGGLMGQAAVSGQKFTYHPFTS
jgi:lipid-binding SYLF domain-containing protein